MSKKVKTLNEDEYKDYIKKLSGDESFEPQDATKKDF